MLNGRNSARGNLSITVVMPTLNSAGTLRSALQSIRSQNFPQAQIEILCVDGGSTDGTSAIAAEFNATMLMNQRVLPEYAKTLGINAAAGDIVILQDSDEVLQNCDSFANRCEAFSAHPEINVVCSSGYVTPSGYSDWSDYYSVVGDPFSRFMYGGGGGDAVPTLHQLYPVVSRSDVMAVLQRPKGYIAPLIDATSSSWRRSAISTSLPHGVTVELFPMLCDLLIAPANKFAVMFNDPIMHYSAASFASVLRKISFRIKNNLAAKRGSSAGFANRVSSFPRWFVLKQALFPLYAASIVFPLLTGVRLALRRKRFVYLLHPVLCIALLLILSRQLLGLLFARPAEPSRY